MVKGKKKKCGKKIVITLVCGVLCGGILAGEPMGYSYYRYQKEQKAQEEAKKQEAESLSQFGVGGKEGTLTGLEENRDASV